MTTVSVGRREIITTLSSAGFSVRNLGLTTVTGTVPITSAWVDVDAEGAPASVHATLDLASLDTGNPRRDHHLRSPSLLDLERHPTLRFCGRPTRTDQGWTVYGTVEAHGASTRILLDASVSEGADGSTTVHASGTLDRRELAVRAPRVLIGHRIEVHLDVTIGPAPEER